MHIDFEQIEAIPDIAERVKAANAALAHTDAARTELTAIKQRAVLELLRQGVSVRKAASILGVSPGRVQQLQKPPGTRHDDEKRRKAAVRTPRG